jgi:hypothetical protein
MRRTPVALIVLVSSVSALSSANPATAASYPVCLAGGSDNALRCDYANFEECRATASGGLGLRCESCVGLQCACDRRFGSGASASLAQSLAKIAQRALPPPSVILTALSAFERRAPAHLLRGLRPGEFATSAITRSSAERALPASDCPMQAVLTRAVYSLRPPGGEGH